MLACSFPFLVSTILFASWLSLLPQFGCAASNVASDAGDLHLLANPESSDHCVDIVGVHGLDGHWERAWTAANDVFWLRDLLPSKIPCARIFSFSYDSRTRWSETPLVLDVSDHAKALDSDLCVERRSTNTERIPIIFIAHSLGGIIVKSALLEAESGRTGHLEHFKAIKLSTYAVLYLGTPHQGGEGVTMLQIITRISSIARHTNERLLSKLERNSDWLQELQARYNTISQDFETIFFYEALKMQTPLGKMIIVPKDSAVVFGARNAEAIPLIADHSSMAKFPTEDDESFRKIAKRLLLFVKDAKARVNENWNAWESKKGEFSHRTQTQQPKQSQDDMEFTLGIAFSSIRNSHFTGREELLRSLRGNLTLVSNAKRLNLVVLYGAGGMGKTQIATEYVHRFHPRYTSTFWIDGSRNSTTANDILNYLETLKRHYEIQNLHERPWYPLIKEVLRKRSEILDLEKSRTSSGYFSKSIDQSLREMFLAWLSSAGNCDWLMVIDNLDDIEGFDFQDWLPSTLCGSVIITSRRRDLIIYWPSVEVDSMTAHEAINLLGQSSGIVTSHATQELNKSMELVQKLGCLPLAISQAGAHIAMSRADSPVSEYLFRYQIYPKQLLQIQQTYSPWDSRRETVLTTWEMSYEAVRQRSLLAADVLAYCGFLSRKLITVELFIGLPYTEFQIHQAFGILNSYSFLQVSDRRRCQTYTIHPLIHLWIRDRMDDDEKKRTARHAAELLLTYNRRTDTHPKPSCDTPANLHVEHLLSIYERLFPCNQTLSDIISVPDLPQDLNLLDIPRNYSIASSAEGWILRLSGWADEFYYFLLSLYTGHSDYGQADYKLLHSLVQTTNGLKVDAMDWTLCYAFKIYPTKHPRMLEMIGNYADRLVVDFSNVRPPLPWYWWLLEARTQVLGPNHLATAHAYQGIGISSLSYEEALTWLSIACRMRITSLGFDDVLTLNTFILLALLVMKCECYAIKHERVLAMITGLVDAYGEEKSIDIFGYPFLLLYHMATDAVQNVTLPEPIPNAWSPFLEVLRVFFSILNCGRHDTSERWGRIIFHAAGGLMRPSPSSSEEHTAWVSAQPYLLALRARVGPDMGEVACSIQYPTAELEVHMLKYRKNQHWSPDGWNWRVLFPLARSVAELSLPIGKMSEDDLKDILYRRMQFKWTELLGPLLYEIRLGPVNGRMVFVECIQVGPGGSLDPESFEPEFINCSNSMNICEETFCLDQLNIYLILMGKRDLHGTTRPDDFRMNAWWDWDERFKYDTYM